MTKYRAKKTVVDNIKFDSKMEANYYLYLKSELQAGRIKEIQLQPKYELIPARKVNGKRKPAIKYIADFLVTYPDGKQEVIDVKGMKTPVYKLKKRLFEEKYGQEIKEVQA